MTSREQTNRDTLSKVIALTEDITRTSQRIHGILWNLMSNPEDITNIKNSINDLHNKVTTLKGMELNAPLVVQEDAVVATIDDASPKNDVNYTIPSIEIEQIEDTPVEEEEDDYDDDPIVQEVRPSDDYYTEDDGEDDGEPEIVSEEEEVAVEEEPKRKPRRRPKRKNKRAFNFDQREDV